MHCCCIALCISCMLMRCCCIAHAILLNCSRVAAVLLCVLCMLMRCCCIAPCIAAALLMVTVGRNCIRTLHRTYILDDSLQKITHHMTIHDFIFLANSASAGTEVARHACRVGPNHTYSNTAYMRRLYGRRTVFGNPMYGLGQPYVHTDVEQLPVCAPLQDSRKCVPSTTQSPGKR